MNDFDKQEVYLYDSPFMSIRLPEQIEPLRLASLGERLTGKIALGKMRRLRPLLLAVDGEAGVELCFGKDEAGQANIVGRITGEITVICQRCMQAMRVPINAEVSLAIVVSQAQAEHLPEQYDPLVVEDGYVSLVELVEDEILLALPVAPMHDRRDCPAGESFIASHKTHDKALHDETMESSQAQDGERKNPFAILAGLKTNLPKSK